MDGTFLEVVVRSSSSRGCEVIGPVTSSMKSKLVVLSEGLVTATHKMIRLNMEDKGLHERHMVSHQNNMVGGFVWKKEKIIKTYCVSVL